VIKPYQARVRLNCLHCLVGELEPI